MEFPAYRMTLRGMMAAVGLIALVLAAALYAVRPRSSTFSVVNRSGRPVSQLLVVVTDFDEPPVLGPKAPVGGEVFAFRDLADGSAATASFLSRGAGSWFEPPKRDAFEFTGRLSDGTRIKGQFGFLPEPESRSRPLFVIDKHGDLWLTAKDRPEGNP
ncbi:MAG: hypothetical protein ACLQIB_19115 [Isosphaeraceae bacterium]